LIYLNPPPRIKVLEALGAIADERIKLIDEKSCHVRSSLGDKEYYVYVDLEKGVAYSDDNGTKYRNYIGYPIIAFLMLKGYLPFSKEIANALKGINWKTLNEKYKRYFIVERIVKKIANSRGIETEEIDLFINETMNILRRLKLKKLENIPIR